jgi:hypothetical protein
MTVQDRTQLVYCATGQSGRGYSRAYARTIYSPDWRETLYIDNREMSDKLRNELYSLNLIMHTK